MTRWRKKGKEKKKTRIVEKDLSVWRVKVWVKVEHDLPELRRRRWMEGGRHVEDKGGTMSRSKE